MNYNSDGQLSIQLPQGPIADDYKIYLIVNVIDDTDGTTVYNILDPVIVLPNSDLANDLAQAIFNNDPNCQALIELNSGNLNLIAKNVIALSTVFNIESVAPLPASNDTTIQANNQENNQLSTIREYLIDKIATYSLSDISSIKVISSALSTATTIPQQVSLKSAVIIILYK